MEDLSNASAASSARDQNRSETDHSDQNTDQILSETDRTDHNTDQTPSETDHPDQNSDQTLSKSDSPDQNTDQNRSNNENAPINALKGKFAAAASQKKTRNSTDRTYTFRAEDEIDEALLNIQNEYQVGKGESVKILINELRYALSTADERIESALNEAKKKVEVIREVPRPLLSGEHLVKLTDQQQQIVKIIASRRKELAKSRGQELEESVGDILVKALFIKGRLFNYDNEFYTGLSKNDAQ